MKWYYEICGGHTHVRVFMNGGKCGDLCFRNEEFEIVKRELLNSTKLVEFIQEIHYKSGDLTFVKNYE